MSAPSDAHLPEDDALQALREALRASPNNSALRLHFADTLLSRGHAAEAERAYREGLAQSPNSLPMKLGLARAFHQQGKPSHALVLLEDLVKHPHAPARAFLLHAKLLVGIGEIEQAVRQYRRAVELDPGVADPEMAKRLGIGASEEESEVVEGKVRAAWDDDGSAPPQEIERPKIAFGDVGGMEKLKEEIRLKIIQPLTHPELYEAYGKRIGGGILMYGPPGCGKTYLARASAPGLCQCPCRRRNQGQFHRGGHQRRTRHVDWQQRAQPAQPVRAGARSQTLRAVLRRGGCVGRQPRHHAGRQLINQFLAEMDGVKSSNEGVLILAATNAPWRLDSAFRRPGRFDRVLFVPPPDAAARAAILRLQCRGKPIEEIDYDHLGRKTESSSGADLKAVLDVASKGRSSDAEHTGCTNLRAMAMVKLGRKAEAGATIDAPLAKNPDNALTHANQGWTLLEQGEPRKALEHFREALRLDPENEWARSGIVEALKARNIMAGVFRCSEGWPRNLMAACTVVLALLGLSLLALVAGEEFRLMDETKSVVSAIKGLIGIFLIGAVASTWLANLLVSQRPRR